MQPVKCGNERSVASHILLRLWIFFKLGTSEMQERVTTDGCCGLLVENPVCINETCFWGHQAASVVLCKLELLNMGPNSARRCEVWNSPVPERIYVMVMVTWYQLCRGICIYIYIYIYLYIYILIAMTGVSQWLMPLRERGTSIWIND